MINLNWLNLNAWLEYLGQLELLNALLFIISLGLIVFLIRLLVLRFLKRRLKDKISYRHWSLNTGYLSVLVIILFSVPAILPSLQGLAAVLGLFGAGILIVNKEILMNMSGWFYLMVRRPFEVGNRVGIHGIYGDVIDIRLMDFTLIETASPRFGGQSTGRVVHIPNSALFTNPLSNASKEFAFNWNEIPVPLTVNSNWKKALTILEKIATEKLEHISSEDERLKRSEALYSIKYKRVKPIVYVEYRKGAIILTIRHLCEPKTRRILTDLIWREILIRFAKEKQIHLNEKDDFTE